MPATKKPAGLDFNHAMIYTRDLSVSLKFYSNLLGFKIVEVFEWQKRPVYARLRAPRGAGTIALHLPAPGETLPAGDGMRLYFEVRDLARFCARLEAAGVQLTKPPKLMPWGWMHAYLDDPDGHEISLYWAGAKRFRKTKMKT